MTATQSLNRYNIALRYFKNEVDASAFIQEIEVTVDSKFDDCKEFLATKKDLAETETRINRSIYIVGLVQFIAIAGSVLAIVSFMAKH